MKKILKPELKLGAEPKKVMILAGLLVVAGVVYLINRGGENNPAGTAAVKTPAPLKAMPAVPGRPAAKAATRGGTTQAGGRGSSGQEFHPVLKPKDPVDTSRVDPTLRLDRLAKLKSVRIEGGSRSLFDVSAAPVVAQIPKVKPIVPGPLQAALTTGPNKAAPPAPATAKTEPAAPPIPLKFYGYTSSQRPGPKRALFLEGEDIFIAAEGDMIKGRYKVIRIGVNSAVLEDTNFKSQQTLPLTEEVVST